VERAHKVAFTVTRRRQLLRYPCLLPTPLLAATDELSEGGPGGRGLRDPVPRPPFFFQDIVAWVADIWTAIYLWTTVHVLVL